MKRVLVLVAHPDDEVLGCGGTLAALHAGDEITVVMLADGETSDNADLSLPPRQLAEARRAMARAAASVLGIKEVVFLGLPDQRLDQTPLLEIIRLVQPVAERVQPAVVYTHSQADLNLDHRIAGQVALTLFRPVPGSPVEEIYAFEVPSSSWGFGQFGRTFAPTVFVDISATLGLKLKALAAYESELRPPPHPRSVEMLRATSAHWGGVCGVSAAEPLELVRVIRRGLNP
jgi:LmbE family N-acetylglucosaminyl deacetylase